MPEVFLLLNPLRLGSHFVGRLVCFLISRREGVQHSWTRCLHKKQPSCVILAHNCWLVSKSCICDSMFMPLGFVDRIPFRTCSLCK